MSRQRDYDQLPVMQHCTSCGECCKAVTARPRELDNIKHYLSEHPEAAWQPPPPEDELRCGFLRDEGDGRWGCSIYPVRPWICRAYGVFAELKCRYFPGDVQGSMPPEDAQRRGVAHQEDRLLGEVFEKGFWARLATGPTFGRTFRDGAQLRRYFLRARSRTPIYGTPVKTAADLRESQSAIRDFFREEARR